MKGKVASASISRTGDSDRYELSITVTIKKGLTHERAEELMEQTWDEYKGKMVEFWAIETEEKEGSGATKDPG